jgi:hypothetical protein
VLESLRADRLLTLAKGKLKITAAGRERVLEERIRFVNGPPPDPPFLVHIGPIATGKTVRQDPEIFKRLAKFEPNRQSYNARHRSAGQGVDPGADCRKQNEIGIK